MNPDRACPHEDFVVDAAINRLTDNHGDEVIAYSADIKVSCRCGERFRWVGPPAGLSAAHPTVSVDEFELRAPIRPASSDPDFGFGIPGFSINYRGGGAL